MDELDLLPDIADGHENYLKAISGNTDSEVVEEESQHVNIKRKFSRIVDRLDTVDREDILNEYKNLSDRERLKISIMVDMLERNIASVFSTGGVVIIPYIGTISKKLALQGMRKRGAELSSARKYLSLEGYKNFARKMYWEEVEKQKMRQLELNRQRRYEKIYEERYLKLVKLIGVGYANLWLITRTRCNVVEFDQDVQDMFDRTKI